MEQWSIQHQHGVLTVVDDGWQMEAELVTMTKRVRSLEEDYDGTETKLQQTSTKLDEATKAADESERSL